MVHLSLCLTYFSAIADIPWPDIPEEMSEEAHDIISKLLNPKYVSTHYFDRVS